MNVLPYKLTNRNDKFFCFIYCYFCFSGTIFSGAGIKLK